MIRDRTRRDPFGMDAEFTIHHLLYPEADPAQTPCGISGQTEPPLNLNSSQFS